MIDPFKKQMRFRGLVLSFNNVNLDSQMLQVVSFNIFVCELVNLAGFDRLHIRIKRERFQFFKSYKGMLFSLTP